MKLKYALSLINLPCELSESLKNANVFYSEEYEKYAKNLGKEAIYVYDDNFIILVFVTKKYIFRFAELPIEYFKWQKSGFVENNHEELFLDELVLLLKDEFKVMWINHSPAVALFKKYPNVSHRIPFGSYIIDLSKTEDEIWGNFSTTYKKYIRQSRDTGTFIKSGGADLIDDFYAMLKASMKRSGASIDGINYYLKLYKELEPHSKIFVAYRDGKAEASVIFLYNSEASYSMYGGISDDPHKGSNLLLYWEAISFMKAAGVKRFSFVGCRINVDKDSKYFGIQTFKERFGGELEQCFLFKVIINKLMYRFYRSLLRVRAKINKFEFKGDIIDQEIHKWKDLNEGRA